MRSSHHGLLRLIGALKLLKAVTLIAVGIGLLKLVHKDVATVLEHWISMLGLSPGGHLVGSALSKATSLPPAKIRELGIVSFIYAGLFLTEGIGLLLLKRWAEWFTVIITGSLVPVEIYECFHHFSALKIVVLLLNIAVVIYLLYRIRTDRESGHRGRG